MKGDTAPDGKGYLIHTLPLGSLDLGVATASPGRLAPSTNSRDYSRQL